MENWVIAAIIIVAIILIILWFGREEDEAIGTSWSAFQKGLSSISDLILGSAETAEPKETYKVHTEQFRWPGDNEPKTEHVFGQDVIGGAAMDEIMRDQYKVYKDKASKIIGMHRPVQYREPMGANPIVFKPNFYELNPMLVNNPFVKDGTFGPISGPSYDLKRNINVKA